MATWPTKAAPALCCTASEKAERVPAAEHVGAERVLVGVVEGDAGRAVDDVGQRSAAGAPSSSGSIPRSGFSMSPATKRNFFACGARDVQPLQEERAALGRREDLAGPPSSCGRGWSPAARRRTISSMRRSSAAWERISLPRKPVAPVSSTRSRGRRPRARSRVARLALQPLDARLHFLLGQVRELAELEVRRRGSRPPSPSWPGARRRVAHGRAPPSRRRTFTERVQAAQRASTRRSRPVSWRTRLPRNWAITSTGWLVAVCVHEQHRRARSAPGARVPSARLTRAM